MDSLSWSRFDEALSSFCLRTTHSGRQSDKIVASLVGEEIEWVGPQAFLFLAESYLQNQQRMLFLERHCTTLDAKLEAESNNTKSLRKQIKDIQVTADDTEWKLQEELAHLTNLLSAERELNAELKTRIGSLEAQHNEVEQFLASQRGSAFLAMETNLAMAKLRVAELEAEKDDLELELRRRNLSGKENLTLSDVGRVKSSYLDTVTVETSGKY